MNPIGVFHTQARHPYEARRQASEDFSGATGEIRLNSGCDFEQALEDLDGFERIWIIYEFHHNKEWKPKVMPPRGSRVKRGVFATRAPYRPNALGLSCVRLVKVEGLRVVVEGHDLLDGTPVLDIKPYIPYADAFPDSRVGWLENIEDERWQVSFSDRAESEIAWLEREGVVQLRGFVVSQLEFDPLDVKRKRVESTSAGGRLAYRTWRADFAIEETARSIQILAITSGYSKGDLEEGEDPHLDKELHRRFRAHFPRNFGNL